MTNANDARKAHKILDDLFKGSMVLDEEREFLRSFLPDLPKQKTLEEIYEYVDDAWLEADDPESKEWLHELHEQLKGLKDAPAVSPVKPTHPEFLEIEADYENAPEGTIVACDDSPPWYKFDLVWISTINCGSSSAESMSGIIREVLRWGWGE